ncbi:hypothetical protein [Adhaeribacter pallidiroseus]|uniref:Lipocalin-like domain-containing protein n=1 Tax=Adhaeribacter pallidiroseus TaxID=2072847 RepID=A0A369QHI6_9BACT|nr:hypothetical protein [Adhaeribacter pallidiroseus]RDC63892.1 hypothetical protein AHMF7616_02501 [Adhaeribacter pallidiroseus]
MKPLYSYLIVIVFLNFMVDSGCVSQKARTASATNQAEAPGSGNSQPAEHAELSGTWEYTMTNEQQEPVTGLLTIQRGGNAGYTGSITLNGMRSENEMAIKKAQLNGSNFIYEGEVITPEGNIPFTLIGTIQGRNMTGQNTVVYRSQPVLWQVKATRK